MEQFKVGDWVVRTDCEFAGMRAGDVDQIDVVESKDAILLRKYITKYDKGHNPGHFRLARPEEIPGYVKSDRVRFYVDTLEDKDIQNLLVRKAESNGIKCHDIGLPGTRYLIFSTDSSGTRYYWFNSHHNNVDTEYTIAQAIEFFKQPKFKVGDWVIATIDKIEYIGRYLEEYKHYSGDTNYRLRPYNILSSTGAIVESTGSFEKILRLATKEEIEKATVPTFKQGDWVSFYSEMMKSTITSKIKEWSPHSYCSLEDGNQPFKHLIKKATKEEIERATKLVIKIGNYTADYSAVAGAVKFGCRRYYKEYVKKLIDTMNEGNIAAIKVEGEMVSSHQIEQIYKGFLE